MEQQFEPTKLQNALFANGLKEHRSTQEDMFSIIDVAAETVSRPKTAADRACDQCKQRKVRCDMKRPCAVCAAKGFQCSYDQARKKRGPIGKRIQAIQRSQVQQSENADSSSNGRPATSNSPEPPTYPEGDLSLHPTMSNTGSYVSTGTFESPPMHWSPRAALQQTASLDSSFEAQTLTPMPNRSQTMDSIFSNEALGNVDQVSIASPSASEFIFPSLPIDSPPASWDPFGTLLQQEISLPTPSVDLWPQSINEERLMPWYDVYFKRLHPTIPILNRTSLYHDLLLRKHHTDRQYGAMLLALCAFAMSQPVQIHERASIPSRSAQARMLMEESVKLRTAPDFGEDPSIEMVLTSFFLFACNFGAGLRKAARLCLREAVDLAYSMGIHLPQSYQSLNKEQREQWLRTFLVLSVTERAYALQQRYSIDFRGRPGMTARFMQAIESDANAENVSDLLFRDSSDTLGMTGLLYLMETFDAIDESVIDCWNGYCRFSDGICELFDRRRALTMFRAQHKAREACAVGAIWLSPTPLPLSNLMESQRADITITQSWLLNRLWNLCFSHDLLRISSDHPELQYDYAYEIARSMLAACEDLSLSSMEVHGVGLAEKIHDIAIGTVEAIKILKSPMTTTIPLSDSEYAPPSRAITIQELLQKFLDLLQAFRGGSHPYNDSFSNSVNAIAYGDG